MGGFELVADAVLGRLVTESRGLTTTTWTLDGLNPIVASTPETTSLYLRDADGELEGELTTALTPAWYVMHAHCRNRGFWTKGFCFARAEVYEHAVKHFPDYPGESLWEVLVRKLPGGYY